MSLAVRIDDDDPTPPYEQLRRQLAGAIESGILVADARLPTVRQLAADLGVAPGTVMRTYAELESAGLVSTGRGAGTTVNKVAAKTIRRNSLAGLADDYVAAARAAGATDADIVAAVTKRIRATGLHVRKESR